VHLGVWVIWANFDFRVFGGRRDDYDLATYDIAGDLNDNVVDPMAEFRHALAVLHRIFVFYERFV